MTPDFQRPFALPAGATELVLVRHGSTAGQTPAAPELIDGQNDPPLAELGQRQAEAVCRRLADERFDELFVTPLRRTHETIAPLVGELDREPVVVEELREVHLGDWEGQLSARTSRRDPLSKEVFELGRWDVIPNAESMDAFGERVELGLRRVVETVGADATAIAVVHGGVIAEACRQATESSPFAFLFAENGSITRLIRLASGRWALRCFNDTAHLAQAVEA